MPDVANAFLVQALIGVTLPVGAVVARYWRGPWPVIGMMTAFGAGALISGVAVDLVAEALEHGTFVVLGAGAVVGGLAFTVLNMVVNARGGFLRKASTTITYLKARQLRRRWNKLRGLDRVAWFHDLPQDELDVIAGLLVEAEYDRGAHVHRAGDRSEHLTIVASGRVELLSPSGARETIAADAFGAGAFLTGAPHSTTAVPLEHVKVFRLPRTSLFDRIEYLPELRRRLQDALAAPETAAYLRGRHGLADDAVETWLDAIRTGGLGRRAVDAGGPTVDRLAELLSRQAWTEGIADDDLDALAERLYLVSYADGEVLYQRGDRGDRQFIVETGEVLVVPPADPHMARRVGPGGAFGGLAFATGVTRMGTAIAAGPAQVWVMRRHDLDLLLEQRPALRQAWARHVTSDATLDYLRSAHGFEEQRAAEVVDVAHRATLAGRTAPEISLAAAATHGAAIAIWLGILLDGIPESFVVGSSISQGIPVALVAGMVLSNFPEALASSRGMADQGMAWRTIYAMWGSLVLVTALVSAIGEVTFAGAGEDALAFVEGIAGGAIITVATETMFPEAFERSGALTGLAALAGFLVAAWLGVVLG